MAVAAAAHKAATAAIAVVASDSASLPMVRIRLGWKSSAAQACCALVDFQHAAGSALQRVQIVLGVVHPERTPARTCHQPACHCRCSRFACLVYSLLLCRQEEVAEKLALGAILGNYKATRHKAKPQRSTLTDVAILAPGLSEAALTKAADIARGVLLARGLVESPANLCTPQYMADAARTIADGASDCMQLKVSQWPGAH